MSKTKGFDIYMRRCRRCGILYRTNSRCSKVCPDCYKPMGGAREQVEVYVRCGTLTDLALERIGGTVRGVKNE